MSWKRKEQANLAYIHHEDYTIKKEATNAARKLRKDGWKTRVRMVSSDIHMMIKLYQLWKAEGNGPSRSME